MSFVRLGAFLLFGFLAGPTKAACVVGSIAGLSMQLDAKPPTPPDFALKPALPLCLRNLLGPEKENCPREEIARYGDEVEAWVEALNTYVTATNEFANEIAVFANSTVEYAHSARQFADLALEFAECEAAAIYSGSEE